MTKVDLLGDRMKELESTSTNRKANKNEYLIARLDGKAFHTFCKGLKKPYDIGLSNLMDNTLICLMNEFHATIGYVQSDEISLVWKPREEKSQFPFDGRFQKLESVMAAFASVSFNKNLDSFLPEKANSAPLFDCRSWSVDSLENAVSCLYWRQKDCVKNAVSMAAQSLFSGSVMNGNKISARSQVLSYQKMLDGKNTSDKITMMLEKGVVFSDYPERFRIGAFAVRKEIVHELSEYELSTIPKKYHPAMITRKKVVLESFLIGKGFEI